MRRARGVLGALALVLGAASAPDAQTMRIVERNSIRGDSLIDRILVGDVRDVQRMVTDWRARETELVRQLRAVSEQDLAQRRRLEEQLALHTRDGFAMMSAIQARCMDERGPRPPGYLGINLTTEFTIVDQRPRALGTRVTSVEPGSPAERAGVQRGDRVVSIGGLDARERVPEIGDQLVPGRTVLLRVERAGVPRDLSIGVAPRPAGFGDSCGEFERALLPMRLPRVGSLSFAERGVEPRRMVVESRDSLPAPTDEVRLFVFSPRTEGRTAYAFFGGAEFRELDDGWREVLGVKQGVIVSTVADGSAAATAGLRSGDVVTAVERSPVTNPMMLVQLLGSSPGESATLSVARGKDRKTVTMRWGPR